MIHLAGHIGPDGKLQVFDKNTLDQWRIDNAGKDVVLSLKIKRRNRSNAQNGYYWSAIVPIVREAINKFGNDFSAEETHEFLKGKFNAKEVETDGGYTIQMPQSTSKLDTKEFMTYIENIQQFASMVLGIYIPGPNEQATIDFCINEQTNG